MQRFITDERTGIQYELIGDYYYPCLTIENEEPPALTKYGRTREKYLREHKKVLYFNLLTSGKLYEHLAEIDTSGKLEEITEWEKCAYAGAGTGVDKSVEKSSRKYRQDVGGAVFGDSDLS